MVRAVSLCVDACKHPPNDGQTTASSASGASCAKHFSWSRFRNPPVRYYHNGHCCRLAATETHVHPVPGVTMPGRRISSLYGQSSRLQGACNS